MNKVLSIEISGQVFWIDEGAYETLSAYLHKIKLQLKGNEYANEIYQDIELRIAELVYAYKTGQKKAVTSEQLSQVIEQVGFLDGDENEQALTSSNPSDPKTKILSGVCGSLATRLGISAFFLRLVFLALIGLFGLGLALYLIFWIALDTNPPRKTPLTGYGENNARSSPDSSEVSYLDKFQRILFLPLSIVGALFSALRKYFIRRRDRYTFILKNIVAVIILVTAIIICLGIYELFQARHFHWPISIIMGIAVLYLVELVMVVFLREYYFTKPRRPIKKVFKVLAIVPIVVLIAGISSLEYARSEYQNESVDRSFTLASKHLHLLLEEKGESTGFAKRVNYKIATSDSADDVVRVQVNYASGGVTQEKARENIQSINYVYHLSEQVLQLSQYWTLADEALYRGQRVEVLVEVPQGIVVTSSHPLSVNTREYAYDFGARDEAHEIIIGGDHALVSSNTSITLGFRYLSRHSFLYDMDDNTKNKLSQNEREILKAAFCNTFFINARWDCNANIRLPVDENMRFDKAFERDSEVIDQLRTYLQPDRSLLLNHLNQMDTLATQLNIEYSLNTPFQNLIEQFINAKSEVASAVELNSG